MVGRVFGALCITQYISRIHLSYGELWIRWTAFSALALLIPVLTTKIRYARGYKCARKDERQGSPCCYGICPPIRHQESAHQCVTPFTRTYPQHIAACPADPSIHMLIWERPWCTLATSIYDRASQYCTSAQSSCHITKQLSYMKLNLGSARLGLANDSHPSGSLSLELTHPTPLRNWLASCLSAARPRGLWSGPS